MAPTLHAYCDDSGSSDKRFQSLAVISLSFDTAVLLRKELTKVLQEKQLKELKFEELRGHSTKMQTASFFLKQAIDFCVKGIMRIDVLLWDHQDERHSVRGRDDNENMQRMYYKILVCVARHWKKIGWCVYPDEQSGIDWNEIKGYLNNTSPLKKEPEFISLFKQDRAVFNFDSVNPQHSHEEPIIQLADLFAGMSRFSHEKGSAFIEWTKKKNERIEPSLFLPENNAISESKADVARFSLLEEFYLLCKKYKLGVSINTRKYLWTAKPENPVNFWNYEVQHNEDKAPTKGNA